MIDDEDVRIRRGRRMRGVPRAITLSDAKAPRRVLAELRAQNARTSEPERPATRSDCVDGPRPCPFVGCRHHLYLEVDPRSGTIKLNRPDLQPWDMPESCSLDVADDGEQTLEIISRLLNLTRERVRQIEGRALRSTRRAARLSRLLAA